MTTGKRTGPRSAAGYGPFLVGLILIVSASVLNLYLAGTSRADREILPSFLVSAYEKSGKLGVTVVLASLGVLVMLWGWLLQAAGGDRTGERAAAQAKPGTRLMSALGSTVSLDTARYLAEAREEGAGGRQP